jgi:signal transduction histidine kinase
MCRASAWGYRAAVDRNVPVAGVLTAGTVTELLIGSVDSPVLVGAALLACLAVAARRRAPLLSSVVVAGAFALPVVAVSRQIPGLGQAPHSWSLTVVWLLTAFTLGTLPDLRLAGVGLVLFGGLSVLYAAGPGSPGGSTLNDALAAVLFSTVVPWLAGLAVGRQRRARAADRVLEQNRVRAAMERTRLARDVHDLVAHSVSLMVVQAEAAEALLPTSPERSAEALRAVQDAGRRALGEMRRTVAALRAGEPAQDDCDLSALPALIDTVRSAGLPVTVATEGRPRQLSADVERSAYRVIREGLTNAVRHSDRTGVLLRLSYGADRVEVTLVDEGHPVRRRFPGGHGVVGMREVVTGLGGTFDAGPAADGRQVLHAVLPVPVPG